MAHSLSILFGIEGLVFQMGQFCSHSKLMLGVFELLSCLRFFSSVFVSYIGDALFVVVVCFVAVVVHCRRFSGVCRMVFYFQFIMRPEHQTPNHTNRTLNGIGIDKTHN